MESVEDHHAIFSVPLSFQRSPAASPLALVGSDARLMVALLMVSLAVLLRDNTRSLSEVVCKAMVPPVAFRFPVAAPDPVRIKAKPHSAPSRVMLKALAVEPSNTAELERNSRAPMSYPVDDIAAPFVYPDENQLLIPSTPAPATIGD